MSLLGLNPSDERRRVAYAVLERHWQRDAQLSLEFDERQKQAMLEDISYGIECLTTAARFASGPIFTEHARWMYAVLVNRLARYTPERVKQMLVTHYETLAEVFLPTLPAHQQALAERLLEAAVTITSQATVGSVVGEQFLIGTHAALRQNYLAELIEDDRIGAIRLIMAAHHAGTPIPELYVDVLQPVMYQVGRLWEQGELTIGQEHRCGLITQGVMARLSSERQGVERHGKSIVACTVGDELHEIGVRMICDLFELNGWDSFCLGAAVPLSRVLQEVEKREADLLALSVTMPIHLECCLQVAEAARERFGTLRIAVGGHPFLIDPNLWRQLPVDICAADAMQFVEWADSAFELR